MRQYPSNVWLKIHHIIVAWPSDSELLRILFTCISRIRAPRPLEHLATLTPNGLLCREQATTFNKANIKVFIRFSIWISGLLFRPFLSKGHSHKHDFLVWQAERSLKLQTWSFFSSVWEKNGATLQWGRREASPCLPWRWTKTPTGWIIKLRGCSTSY